MGHHFQISFQWWWNDISQHQKRPWCWPSKKQLSYTMGNFASTNSTLLYVNSLFALGYTTAQLTRKKLFENEELNRPNLSVLCDAANTNNVQKQETSVWTHFKSRSDSNCAFLCSFAIWCQSEETNWGEHGQDQDWISCRILVFFWIRIGFGYSFLKKIGSGHDQDICLISITKFSWEWFKMSQMMVLLFSLLLWFLY